MARRDLDAKDASANVAAIRQMIAQSNTWKQIQALDDKPAAGAKTHTKLRLRNRQRRYKVSKPKIPMAMDLY